MAGREPQIGDARLVQLPMKTTSTFLTEQGLTGLQAHVGQGFFKRGFLCRLGK